MKILIYTDVHFSTTSSIIRRRGVKYSERLENVIQSVNWAENLANIENCDEIICLGDFFDKPTLSDEELTALTEIQWANLPHTFIVGNHESSVDGLRYNSVNSLKHLGFNIISEPITRKLKDRHLVFLPYILEENRKRLKDYIENPEISIIFSHNDIKGIRYGKIESPHGFELSDIEENCKLFLNGHLHNGMFLNKSKSILNLGNLTGQNFGEDAENYEHCILIVDTETLELTLIENPYAYNFYKLEVDTKTNITKLLSKLKNNSVVSFKCIDTREQELHESILSNNCINNYRIVIYSAPTTEKENEESSILITSVDHLKQFTDFILSELGESKVVKEELYQVCQ